MRRRSCLAVLVLAGVGGQAVACVDRADGLGPPEDLDAVVNAIEDAVPAALDDAHVPGAAVALATDGDIEWSAGFGVTTPGGPAVESSTVFQVGSISKPVAAATIVTLAEEGVVDLDVPVSEHLDSWQLPASSADPDAITLRSLLSHTAGINVGGYLGLPDDQPLGTTVGSLDGETSALDGEAVAQTEEPGTYRYSGGGYTIAQLAVEDVTGRPWPEVAQGAVFDALGMASSGYGCTTADEVDGSIAAGHDADGRPNPRYRYVEYAAAGLCSSADDLGRFAVWLAGDDAVAVAMREPTVGTDGAYGLGLHLDGATVGHEGVNRGFYADLVVVPDDGFAVVVLTNGDNGRDVVEAVFDAL